MKNDTSQILSELRNIIISKPDESINKSQTKTDVALALNEIIDKIKIDAKEESDFEIAKKMAKINYLNEEKRQLEIQEQQKIAIQLVEVEQYRKSFLSSTIDNDDTPPTPLPLFDEEIQAYHLNLSTQMLNMKEFNRKVNLALMQKFKIHLTVIGFLFSLLLFFATKDNKKIATAITMPNKKVMNQLKVNDINISSLQWWPVNYVMKDNINNISSDSPDLIIFNLFNKSINNIKELNLKQTGSTGDNKKIKRINKNNKQENKIKKEKIQFNLNAN